MGREREGRDWQKDLSEENKKLLQELHNLYSVFVLAKMDKTDLASKIHNHCTKSISVQVGLLITEIQLKLKDLPTQTKPEHEVAVNQIIADGVRKDLSLYKAFALQITGRLAESEEMKNMFQTWEEDPTQAYKWLSFRGGKTDDFSLIALQVKSS